MTDAAAPGATSLRLRIRSWTSGAVARGAAAGLVIRLAGLAALFLQMLVAARLLGPEAYGALALVGAVSSLGGFAACLGLDQNSAFELGRSAQTSRGNALRAYRRKVILYVLGAAACIALSIVAVGWFAPFSHSSQRMAIIAGGLLVPVVALILLSRGFAQGLGRMFRAQLPLDLIRPATFLVALLALWAAVGVVGNVLAVAAFAGASIGAALVGIAFGMKLPSASARPDGADQSIAISWRRASAFWVSSLALIATGEVHLLMVGGLSSLEETGLFSSVYRISGAMLVGVAATAFAFAPRASAYFARSDKDGLARLTQKTAMASFLVSVPACLLVLLFAEPILGLLGDGFRPAAPALRVLAAVQLVVTALGPGMVCLSMTGRALDVAGLRGMGLLVGVALGVWLIPTEGSLGGALAYGACLLTQSVLAYIRVVQVHRFDASLVGCISRLARRA